VKDDNKSAGRLEDASEKHCCLTKSLKEMKRKTEGNILAAQKLSSGLVGLHQKQLILK
jgi:hypothetical protein